MKIHIFAWRGWQVKELEDKAKDVEKTTKGRCEKGILKRMKDQLEDQDSAFNCFRAVLAR
jgi:hypothetical protein